MAKKTSAKQRSSTEPKKQARPGARRSEKHPNLIPFEKNDPRINRKGRPRGPSIRDAIIKELEGNEELVEALAKSFIRHALKGRGTYAKEVIETTDGKVVQGHDVGGPDGEPITMVVQVVDDD